MYEREMNMDVSAGKTSRKRKPLRAKNTCNLQTRRHDEKSLRNNESISVLSHQTSKPVIFFPNHAVGQEHSHLVGNFLEGDASQEWKGVSELSFHMLLIPGPFIF